MNIYHNNYILQTLYYIITNIISINTHYAYFAGYICCAIMIVMIFYLFLLHIFLEQ